MSLPSIASLEEFSLAELRDLVGVLLAEVGTLRSGSEAQQATIVALRAENQALRDEVARLKGLPPRPPLRPSGMEQATQPGAADQGMTRPKLPRGVKRDRDAVTAERVLKVAVPSGSRFKGYEDILVRDLHVSAELIRYRRERWVLPSGETVLAPLPAGIIGGFGPELRRFVLALHAQGQVTTERLVALLNGIGVEIYEAPGGAALGRAARRLRGRGPGGAAGRLGDRALGHGGRHRRAACSQGWGHDADRRRPVHRVPDRRV